MTIDLLRRVQAWTEGALSPAATVVMLPEFVSRPVWFPGSRQAGTGGSGHGVQRLRLFPGEPGELPTLPVWLEDPAAQDPPIELPVLHHSAGALLAFAMSQRFQVVLGLQGEHCTLTYDDLLGLRALMLVNRMSEGESPPERRAPVDLSALVPALLTYCQAQPGVRRAWLVLIASAVSEQATVMLDATRAEWHEAELARVLDPLLPPGVSLTFLEVAGNFRPEVREAIAALPPQHDAAARPGWVDRVRQKFVTAAVPVIELDVHSDRLSA